MIPPQKFGIIGPRPIINPIADHSITNPLNKSSSFWLTFEPKTSLPHGESPTVCSNLTLNWLNSYHYLCLKILYFPPPPHIGANLFKSSVTSDDDFILPHKSIHQLKLHSLPSPQYSHLYQNYLLYLLNKFPNLLVIPLEAYLNFPDILPDHSQLSQLHPNIVNLSFLDSIKSSYNNNISSLISSSLPHLRKYFNSIDKLSYKLHHSTLSSHISSKLLPQLLSPNNPTITKSLLASINITYNPSHNLLPPPPPQYNILTSFDNKFFPIALRLFISLRSIALYKYKITSILYDDFLPWQLNVLSKLNITFHFAKKSNIHFMCQRFIDAIPLLNHSLPTIFLDSDIWCQSPIDSILPLFNSNINFGTWHGHSIILNYPHLQHKYLQILQLSPQHLPNDQPQGAIPHGGFHGGPPHILQQRYSLIQKHLHDNLIPNKRSSDELSLFISSDPLNDKFSLNSLWTSYPSYINLNDKLIYDHNHQAKPFLHFERNQKASPLTDFFLLYPDKLSQVIDDFHLHELIDNLKLWHSYNL